MKRSIVIAVLLTLSMLFGACGTIDNTLVIGMELAYPPFEMTDETGKPSGISVEMAKALGEYLGRPVRIENIAWSGLIPSLTTQKIDLIISSMTITEERKKTVAFSDPYCKAYLAILTNIDSGVKSITDLNQTGMKVAVKKGSTGYIYASENMPEADILVFDKESACVLEVAQGRADAFLYDQMTIFKNWQQYPESTTALLEPFNDYEYWGAAMRLEDTELLAQVNAFVKDFEQNDGFNKLATTYLTDIKKEFDARGIPFFFSSK